VGEEIGVEVGVRGWWMLCTQKRSLSSLSFHELLELEGTLVTVRLLSGYFHEDR